MSRRARIGGLVAPLLVLTAVGLGDAAPIRAQNAASLARTPAEAEALQTLEDGLYVSARTQAETVLRQNPDSIVGHYVLGRAFFDAEGSLARAMYHLGRARELYEGSAQAHGEFHQELLFQTARLAGQMELYEFQLELLGYHDHLYDPDLIAERCWPLMKLGRMDEAREFANTAAGSPDPWQRSAGLNALCAVEGEARSRSAYRAACLQALEGARAEVAGRQDGDEGAGIAVDAYNAALASAAALQVEEARSLAMEGVRRFEPTGANPWQVLVELNLSDGRMDEALNAFANMVSWNDRMPASLRDQGRAELEAMVAMVMLLAGETEQARVRIDRALDRPDRRGLTTDGAEQARGRHALLRRMIRRTLAEERAEQASWEGRGAQLSEAVTSLPSDLFAGFPDDERVVAVLTDEGRLQDTVRPYMPGGIDGLSPWLTGELIDVLGPAVVAVAVDQAREADAEEPRAEPFYLALDAEIAAARGDEDRALTLASQALEQLTDPGWALVRGRLAARVAAMAEDEGRARRANELYQIALETDPSVIRRLGLSLPVRLTSSGAEASEAADLLSRSPRFHEEDGAFVLAVEPSPTGLRACLRSATGDELRCVEAQRPAEDEEDPLPLPQRLAYQVHRQLFAARIALSTVDLRSLDGHTNGGTALANDRLRELME